MFTEKGQARKRCLYEHNAKCYSINLMHKNHPLFCKKHFGANSNIGNDDAPIFKWRNFITGTTILRAKVAA